MLSYMLISMAIVVYNMGVPTHFSILWYQQHLGNYMLGNFLETICWKLRLVTIGFVRVYFGPFKLCLTIVQGNGSWCWDEPELALQMLSRQKRSKCLEASRRGMGLGSSPTSDGRLAPCFIAKSKSEHK